MESVELIYEALKEAGIPDEYKEAMEKTFSFFQKLRSSRETQMTEERVHLTGTIDAVQIHYDDVMKKDLYESERRGITQAFYLYKTLQAPTTDDYDRVGMDRESVTLAVKKILMRKCIELGGRPDRELYEFLYFLVINLW